MEFDKNIKLFIWLICISMCSLFLPKHETVNDALVYNTATHFFITGLNPYAVSEWLEYWEAWGTSDRPMVWNPAFFYVLYLPVYYLYKINNLLPTALSVFMLGYSISLVWKLCCSKNIPDYAIGLFTLFSAPTLFALQVNQISIMLMSFYILLIYLYFNQRYFLAGMLVPILLVKPHIYILSLPALFLASVLEKKYQFIIAATFSLFSLCVVAEIINPDVNYNWIYREKWPVSFIGNSLSGLFRHVTIAVFKVDLSWFSVALTALACCILVLKSILNGANWIYANFPVLIMFDPIVAPYGFISDHITIIIPFIILLGFTLEKNRKHHQLYVTLCFLSILILTFQGASYIQIVNYPDLNVYMFMPMVFGLLAWSLAARLVSFKNIYFWPKGFERPE